MSRRGNRPKRPRKSGKPKRPRKPGKPKRPTRSQKPLLEEISQQELEAIVQRARTGPLSEQEHAKLKAAVDTLSYLTQALEAKGASIRRLRKLLFGASTEKTSQVLGDGGVDNTDSADSGPADEAGGGEDEGQHADGEAGNKKRKGHGRNGAKDYTGAERVKVPHETLSRGDHCPECQRGKLYPMAEPAVMVRVRGMAPLRATVYERQRLRCNLCGQVFVARAPAGVGGAKYDETAASMIGLLKYGCGLPFNRLERLERDLGIPLPASTQWGVVHEAADKLAPAYQELIRQAAQGEVLHNDDTTMKILELLPDRAGPRSEQDDDDDTDERTGVYTSGILSVTGGHKVALFFTGRRHAGENLQQVLARRAAELPAPVQMCDGLSHNTAGDFKTILANCMAHSRRKYVEVADSFPEQVRHVLLQLRKVYKTDALARSEQMTPQQRLDLHQAQSGPVMRDLEKWLQAQLDEKLVEPNSTLGEAIAYMQKHWQALTLFLRQPGAPLDNNIVERALKKAILHRKNALFYKTENGARVGDLYMSLIHTCELCGADPFDYFTALQRHAEAVAEAPAAWLPWSYKETLQSLASTP
jgi:transposase